MKSIGRSQDVDNLQSIIIDLKAEHLKFKREGIEMRRRNPITKSEISITNFKFQLQENILITS